MTKATTTPQIALVLSGGGARATAFHLGLMLRLAAEQRLEQVAVLSTVSGGSLAAGLMFSSAGLSWPTSQGYLSTVLPWARDALVERSLQGSAVTRTLLRPWKLGWSRGDLLAQALEHTWGMRGSMKQLAARPHWFINATCYETGRNWRFSQKHIGDYRFGHNFTQDVPVSVAVAASAAIPYMAGFVKLRVASDGWFAIDPATDEPRRPVTPARRTVRLWDGGVYENLGIEPVHKLQRGFVDKSVNLLIVSDASAYLTDELGPATGVFTGKFPFLRPPRLFDIATEQTRALRSRMLMTEFLERGLPGSIVRLGRSVAYVDRQSKRNRGALPGDSFLDQSTVDQAAVYPTNASKMAPAAFQMLLRHGFESADATLTAYRALEFPNAILWREIEARLPWRQ